MSLTAYLFFVDFHKTCRFHHYLSAMIITPEVADVAQLREELHQTDTKRKIAESDLQVAAEELVKLNEEKESLQQARDCYMLNEKQLQEKVTKLEQELFDWRNSTFASVKA